MNEKNFCKVTLAGGRSVVVFASSAEFFRKQGAEISEPTIDEIIAHFPEHAKDFKNVTTAAPEAETESEAGKAGKKPRRTRKA